MSNAPANIPIKDLGATVMGKCEVCIPGQCKGDPSGPLKTYKDTQSNQQINACKACHDQMVLAGQWVDIP